MLSEQNVTRASSKVVEVNIKKIIKKRKSYKENHHKENISTNYIMTRTKQSQTVQYTKVFKTEKTEPMSEIMQMSRAK